MLAKKKSSAAAANKSLLTAPRFQQLLARTNRLADAVELFEQALSGAGAANHSCCRLVLERHAIMLFGNAPHHSEHITAASDGWDIETPIKLGRRHGESVIMFPVQLLIGDPLVVSVGYEALPDESADRAFRARLHALAIIYAHRSLTLWEVEEDLETSAPLTLKERITFAMILSGYAYFEIAEQLECSPAAVTRHIESATAKLKISDTAAAVALAARRGWLHVPQFFKK